MGDSVIPAEDPDWSAVKETALTLFERTRDLRVSIYLTQSLAKLEGLSGFGEGLTLLRTLLESQWKTVHPQLDAEDNDDATMRVNALAVLDDVSETVRHVRTMPLVSDPFGSSFSLRDILVSRGEARWSDPDRNPPTSGDIDAAFASTNLADLEELNECCVRAANDLESIETLVVEQVGAAQTMSLNNLSEAIDEIKKIISPRLADRNQLSEDKDSAGLADSGRQEPGAAVRRGESFGSSFDTRAQIVSALDMACDYFARNEPSSPVPILLRRAKGLIGKDFMSILKDITPNGVSQAEVLKGADDAYTDTGNAFGGSSFSESTERQQSSEPAADTNSEGNSGSPFSD